MDVFSASRCRKRIKLSCTVFLPIEPGTFPLNHEEPSLLWATRESLKTAVSIGLWKIFFITFGFATSYILLASCILHPMFFSLFKQVIAWDGSFLAAYSNWFPTSEPKVSATKWRAFCALQSSRNSKRWFMMVDDLPMQQRISIYLYMYICFFFRLLIGALCQPKSIKGCEKVGSIGTWVPTFKNR